MTWLVTLFSLASRAFGLVTSWFTFAERQQDIRAGRDQQTAATDAATIAAQQREMQAAANDSDEAETAARLRGGMF